VGKTSHFDAKCVNISKSVGDTSLLLMTNILIPIGSCIRAFDTKVLIPGSMTLNGISSNFQRILLISPIWDATTPKRMKYEDGAVSSATAL